MSDNVVYLDGETTLPIPIDRVLSTAKDKLTDGVVIGYTEDDGLYFACSFAKTSEVSWILEQAKAMLMDHAREQSGERDGG